MRRITRRIDKNVDKLIDAGVRFSQHIPRDSVALLRMQDQGALVEVVVLLDGDLVKVFGGTEAGREKIVEAFSD